MGRINKIILMIAFVKSFKNYVTIQILVLILISVFIINFYSFYGWKRVDHDQIIVPILENRTNLHKEQEVKKDEEIGTHIGEIGCITPNLIELYHNKIMQIEKKLDSFYFKTPNSDEISKRCKQFEASSVQNNFSVTEASIQDYFTNRQFIKILKNSTLLKASNKRKGSHLKLLLHLSNGITAIFKPKWYPNDQVLHGSFHYDGEDRPVGEVVAFYLSILLDFKNVPVATIRKLDINEVLRVSDSALSYTFVGKDNHICLYGVCTHCDRSNLICSDDSNTMEGSMVMHLPPDSRFNTGIHPWMRSYRCNISAMWEIDDNYCPKVSMWRTFVFKGKNTPLFFDLMDASVFDFLMDNGDRHNYEYIMSNKAPRMILLDNGKGMGNPDIDHIDILAPLFQCCFLRNSTWNTLVDLRGGNLSYWLRYLVASDPEIVLTEKHFKAFDRRLLTIFAILEDCFRRKGMQNVILND